MSVNPCEQPPVYKLYVHTFLGFGSTLRGRAARLEHYSSATSCSIRPWDSSVGTSTLGRPASYTPWLCGRLLLAGTVRGLNLGQPPGRATLQPTMENNYGDGTSTTKLGADCAPMLTTFCSIAVLRAFKVHLPPELAVGLLPFVMLAPNFWYANRHRRTAGRKMRSRKSQRGDICPHALAHVQF
jgi:hypothetical protein